MSHFAQSPLDNDLSALSMVFDFDLGTASAAHAPQRLHFSAARALVCAWQPDEVLPALRHIEHAVQQGAWAAGCMAYEAAAGLDPAMKRAMTACAAQSAPAQPTMPLLAFALFAGPDTSLPFAGGVPTAHPCTARSVHATGHDAPNFAQWKLSEEQDAYVAKVDELRAAIAAGDMYQVNYTIRADACCDPDFFPWLYYEALLQRQQCRYGAFLDFSDHQILSLSPELFFDWNRNTGAITTRPMKGTAPRGTTPEADAAQAYALQTSSKERAENVMIVDLLRNDLGRIARTGSVHVPQLLHTEPYPTLWQMTSTVQAITKPDTTFTQVLQALFPCGSITGAPKHMAMRKIARLEPEPRGVYCGAVGFIHKERALFNVAIRTIAHTPATRPKEIREPVSASAGHMRCGAGGGITWPSDAMAEYAEARLKLRFLHTPPLPQPDFALRETLLLANGRFALLPLHLQRLNQSARACRFQPVGHARQLHALQAFATQHGQGLWRVMLTQTADGKLSVQGSPLQTGDVQPPGADWHEKDALPAPWLQPPAASNTPRPMRVALAPHPNSTEPCWLLHKTTQRAHYDAACAAVPHAWDVILHTPQGFATECTRGNLVLQTARDCITPPLARGLLPGTLREALLTRQAIREADIPLQRLLQPQPHDRLWFINSVRGWLPVALDWPPPSQQARLHD